MQTVTSDCLERSLKKPTVNFDSEMEQSSNGAHRCNGKIRNQVNSH